jgi:hypothetical protein
MAAMDTLILDWNGTELPQLLRNLPPGQYRIEPVDAFEPLTEEEDAGIRRAMDDLDAGNGRPLEDTLARARAIIARR